MAGFFNPESPFMTGLNKFCDILILNLLTLLLLAPALVMAYVALLLQAKILIVASMILSFPCGAAITAMHYMLLKIVRDEETYIVKGYFKSFKLNFRQATVIWLIELSAATLIYFDFKIVKASIDSLPAWLPTGLMVATIIIFMLGIHVFPLLSRFENTIFKTIKNSILVGLMTFPKTILMTAICIAPIVLIYFFERQLMPILILIGISGPGYLCALLYNKSFKKLEPATEEKDPDAWYVEPVNEEVDADNSVEVGQSVTEDSDNELEITDIESGE